MPATAAVLAAAVGWFGLVTRAETDKLGAVNSSNTHEMLIVINGTVGVGKTSISQSLTSKIPGAVCIEGDCLGFASPKNDYVLNAAMDLISAHRRNGVRIIVLDMFFNDAQKLDWFLSQVGIESHVFYLAADEDEIARRIRQRARPRTEAEIVDSRRLRQSQDMMKNRGVEVDTKGKNAEEISESLLLYLFT